MKQFVWRAVGANMRRSPYQSLIAAIVMAMAFFISTVFILVAGGSHFALRYFETRPQVTAFFKEEVPKDQLDALINKLSQEAKIKETKYTSKEEALKIYREQNKGDPLLLEMVTANILPSSLDVATDEVASLAQIAKVLQTDPLVEEVVFQQDVVKSLENWARILRVGGGVLVCCLMLVAFLTDIAVIGMKASSKRKEVGILSLVGASPSEIKMPFVLEGSFYGIIGAVIGWGFCYILLLYVTPFLKSFLGNISLLPAPFLFMLAILGGEVFLGTIFGAVGSLLAIKKYLK